MSNKTYSVSYACRNCFYRFTRQEQFGKRASQKVTCPRCGVQAANKCKPLEWVQPATVLAVEPFEYNPHTPYYPTHPNPGADYPGTPDNWDYMDKWRYTC